MTDRKDPRTPRARRLRSDATPAERTLWLALKQLPIEDHFRCQAPVGPYFADFAHDGCRLIIELDGGQHNQPDEIRRDEARTAYLNAAGYRVLRFWNLDVIHNLEGVIEAILAAVARSQTPNPSPPQPGEGKS